MAFVDVERSTELLVQRGDVQGLVAVESVLAFVRERIEPYGGREVKTLGDGLMLVFPAPRQVVAFAVATQRALLGRFQKPGSEIVDVRSCSRVRISVIR